MSVTITLEYEEAKEMRRWLKDGEIPPRDKRETLSSRFVAGDESVAVPFDDMEKLLQMVELATEDYFTRAEKKEAFAELRRKLDYERALREERAYDAAVRAHEAILAAAKLSA